MLRKKVLFVAQNLCVGGVQTSLINLLCNMLEEDEYLIDLFLFAGGELLENVPDKINIIYGHEGLRVVATPFRTVVKSKKLPYIIARVFYMIMVRVIGSQALYRKFFDKVNIKENYDIAVSYFNDVPNNYFYQGTNLYVSEYVKAAKKVAWIHTDPVLSGFDKDYCRKLYSDFDSIVCVSNAVKQKMDLLLPEYSDKTEVVYNRFNRDKIIRQAEENKISFENDKLNIITVARIDNASKRLDMIIRISQRLKREGITNFCWRIVGDGPDLKENKKLVKELDVDGLVVFEGVKINPYPYIKNSDLFVLCSVYEGYPMVIGEAIILGVPVLTKEYAAAYEQISEDKGCIAKSDDEFYDILKDWIILKTYKK